MPPSRKKPARKKTTPKKPEALREQINVLALIEALENHVLGKVEMNATQVSAALALLKKILPDISENRLPREAALMHEDALADLE